MYELCAKEKDEIKAKAMTILKRVKELEEKHVDYEIIKTKLASTGIVIIIILSDII